MLEKRRRSTNGKTNSLTQFQELNSSELNQITGGDWWSEILNLIALKNINIPPWVLIILLSNIYLVL
ncbi:ComC/BlpC family leader-containing pheromone/bacteriocin [Streptococcus equi subsp. equi]|nr:ComC/BlpC family leader-containing pheromone/bacteriocin [Streptococcus equi subsp. equi]